MTNNNFIKVQSNFHPQDVLEELYILGFAKVAIDGVFALSISLSKLSKVQLWSAGRKTCCSMQHQNKFNVDGGQYFAYTLYSVFIIQSKESNWSICVSSLSISIGVSTK